MATNVNKREYAAPHLGVKVVEVECRLCRLWLPPAQVEVKSIWAGDGYLDSAHCLNCLHKE